MSEVEVFRNSNLMDPSLHIWGWQVAVYLFLGGVAAGLMFLSAVFSRRNGLKQSSRWIRLSTFLAPFLVSVGMFVLLMDLEFKAHVFRFYTAFRWTSPMSWGAWILLLIYPAGLLLGSAGLSEAELQALARRPLLRRMRVAALAERMRSFSVSREAPLAWINLALGVALGGYTGILLSSLAARALWNSPLLAPLFLMSGLSTGAALLMLLPVGNDEHTTLRNWDLAAISLELVLILSYLMSLTVGGGLAGSRASALFLGGGYTAVFWVVVIVAGLLIPLLLEAWELRRRIRPTATAPVLLLIGGLALRWILTMAGQASS